MKVVRAVASVLGDLVIGDDWRITLGIVLTLAATAGLAKAGCRSGGYRPWRSWLCWSAPCTPHVDGSPRMSSSTKHRRPPGILVLLRHGQSTANAADDFSGWQDVALTGRGRDEAANAAAQLLEHALLPDVVHTSLLARAISTADIVSAGTGRPWLPVRRSWWLNERHYGALQGRSKSAVRKEVGDETFALWRRSYGVRPPALAETDPGSAVGDERYAALPPEALPSGESLADVAARLLPYWQDVIAADLRRGLTTLVVAHGNSLRAIVMHLDTLTEDEVAALNVPTGVPVRYDLDDRLRPTQAGGRYLDPDAATAGAAEVAAQGR